MTLSPGHIFPPLIHTQRTASRGLTGLTLARRVRQVDERGAASRTPRKHPRGRCGCPPPRATARPKGRVNLPSDPLERSPAADARPEAQAAPRVSDFFSPGSRRCPPPRPRRRLPRGASESSSHVYPPHPHPPQRTGGRRRRRRPGCRGRTSPRSARVHPRAAPPRV
jgi:hypothetical protein